MQKGEKRFQVPYQKLLKEEVEFPLGVTIVDIEGRRMEEDFLLLDKLPLPESVEKLYIKNFFVSAYVNLSMCTNLQKLTLQNCNLMSIGEIIPPPNLIVLNVGRNLYLEFLDLTRFVGLKNLVASGCRVKEMPRGGEALEMLNLSSNDIHSLQEFDFSEYSNLRELNLFGNPIKELDFAKAPPGLEILILISCPNLKSIDSFTEVDQLSELHIDYSGLENLPHHEFPSLETLAITGGPLSLKSLDALEFMAPNLISLNFSGHDIGDFLCDLYLPKRLEELKVHKCGITSIAGVEWPAFLRFLSLHGNRLKGINAEDLPNSLYELHLRGNIPPLDIDLAKISSSILVVIPNGEVRNGEMEAVNSAPAPKMVMCAADFAPHAPIPVGPTTPAVLPVVPLILTADAPDYASELTGLFFEPDDVA